MDYKGKQVKLLMQNNIIIEGVVKSWNANSVHLLSLDGKSTSIITHPDEDIRVIKVLHDVSQNLTTNNNSYKEIKNFTEPTQEECSEESNNNDLQLKNLVELKQELIKQEKELVANQLKNHHISQVRTIQYELPGFLKK
jgi:hypothetical protein